MTRPSTHHLAKNYPYPTLTSASPPAASRNRIERFGTVMAPLHYEPEYAYPLVIWLDETSENDHSENRLARETRVDSAGPEGADQRLLGHSVKALSLSSAMNWISLRNFAAVSARAFETASPSPDGLDRLVQTASAKLNIHANRVFLVLRGTDWTGMTRFLAGSSTKLAGVVWIDRYTDSPRHRLLGAGLQVTPLAHGPATQLLIATEDLPDSIAKAMQDARALHSVGWEPTVVASKAGSSFDRSALANANRWMMGIVTGQPAFPDLPTASKVPTILEN